MKNFIPYIIILLLLYSCQNKDRGTKKSENSNSASSSKAKLIEKKVVFSAYTTAINGLNYHKAPIKDSEILGKFNYGTKVDIIEDRNRTHFWVDDSIRGSLYGKWVGVKKDSMTVYVFDPYLFKSSAEMDKHMKLLNGKLELIYNDTIRVNPNQKMIVEKHIQTSNHLADYVIIKLEEKNKVVYNYEIEHLFKKSYTIEKNENSKSTFKYFTLFDEDPTSEYEQTFSITENEIIKIKENYFEAEEAENNN